VKNKQVIIIGAGLAGLASGIYAQMNGYKTRIYEYAARPGGVSATWKRKGYTIDGGIHFYIGSRPGQPIHTIYRELGIDQTEQYRTMDVYGRFVDMEQNITIDLTRDLLRLATDLKTLAPEDAGFIDRFINAVRLFQDADFLSPMAKPPELTRFRDTMKMMWGMRKSLRYYSGPYTRPVNHFTRNLKNPFLREFIEHIFLPDVPVWFILFTMGMFTGGNMALRRDGSAGFAKALEHRYLSLGGQVTYRTRVQKINVRNNKAVGVKLDNGEEDVADTVVSAADGHSTLFELLDGRYLNTDIKNRYDKWPLFTRVVLANFGVDGLLEDEPWMVVMKSPEPLTAGFLSDDWMPIRIFNYGSGFSPPGKTLVQVMIASQWEPWNKLHQDKKAYKAEKRETADQILQALCRRWPGIDSRVEMTDVATPYTWWRHTLNRRGAFEGFAVTHKAINTKIHRTLPGLENVYLAGQWNSPGGGVIPSFMTGKHAVMLMCRDDNRRFSTTKN